MRVLILSDIHANLVALETVLRTANGQYDTVWCLGDVVGYGPRPNECIELVREHATLCVMGNHDWAVLDRPGINVDDFNPNARQAVLWTREVLTAQNRQYLEQLLATPVRPPGVKDLLLTHASPRQPVWEYIETPSVAIENFAIFDEQLCFVGHTHKPAVYLWRLQDDGQANASPHEIGFSDDLSADDLSNDYANDYSDNYPDGPDPFLDGQRASLSRVTVLCLQPQPNSRIQLDVSERRRMIVNPGSVGQPRDRDVRAAYAIFDTEKRIWDHQRVTYPIELTQNQMRAVSLPRRLIDRLSFGL
jgi:predicted phosphodiesterase